WPEHLSCKQRVTSSNLVGGSNPSALQTQCTRVFLCRRTLILGMRCDRTKWPSPFLSQAHPLDIVRLVVEQLGELGALLQLPVFRREFLRCRDALRRLQDDESGAVIAGLSNDQARSVSSPTA